MVGLVGTPTGNALLPLRTSVNGPDKYRDRRGLCETLATHVRCGFLFHFTILICRVGRCPHRPLSDFHFHDIYNLEYNCSCCIHRISKPVQQSPVILLYQVALYFQPIAVINGCKENNISWPSCWPSGTALRYW